MLTVTAPAKVNLFLAVGPALGDGYHAVTTVLHTIELADTLRFKPAPRLSLTCEPDVGVPEHSNLAYRAAVAMGEAFGREPAFAIELRKAVPHGAGLGGGSSDAAAVVLALAHAWGIDARSAECLRVAAALGADVPFFLAPGGAALMTGRGDELSAELPALAGVPVALVRPETPVPTAAAYAAFDAAPQPQGDPHGVLAALRSGDAGGLAAALENNLQAASEAVVPQVGEALAWTRAASGVAGALVAGSGSAVFGLCGSDEAARDVARAARERGWWSVATRLGPQGVSIEGGVA